jgi:hypothetical protein
MKNASQIITSLQYKPQYHKILEHRCIKRLICALLLNIQNNIKYGYIKNDKLYIVISATLNKYDKDNIINTIKMILNSPMILKSQKFMECLDITLQDVIVYTDHKPKIDFKPYHNEAYKLTYHERASGEVKVDVKDKKLNQLLKEIQTIIKERV